MKVTRALVSVSDKSGLEGLVRGLADLGVEIVSTGGTAKAIEALGIAVTPIDEVTGHPEILGGRVKTLHPKVHGGILARLDVPSDVKELEHAEITPIGLVVINLYPFEDWAGRRGATPAEVVEQIDIGGPAMIRAAAKNHARVGVLTDTAQYAEVLDELRAGDGELTQATRTRLAAAAFQRTARYDAAIADWMTTGDEDFPESILIGLDRHLEVSYGENPHQRAAYYTERGARTHLLERVEKIHGKDLSFNNLYDLDAARGLLAEFELPTCVIVKHNNPCGVAVASDVRRRLPPRPRRRSGVGLRRGDRRQPPGRRRARGTAGRHLRRGAAAPRDTTRMRWRPSHASRTRGSCATTSVAGAIRASATCDGSWAGCSSRTGMPRARTATA